MLNIVCCSLSLPRTCLRRNQQFYSTLVAEKHTLNVCIVFVVIDETLFLSMLLYLNLLLQAVNVFWSDHFLGTFPLSCAPIILFCRKYDGVCGKMASPMTERPLKPGFYRVELFKTIWEVPTRYQDLSPVGTGAYGTVWWAGWGRSSRCICMFPSRLSGLQLYQP